jgi:cytochrome c biogenesis protein CcdA
VLRLAIAVVAIALPDCINPSLIAAELFLAAGEHPGRRTVLFTASAWTVTFLVGLALALGLGDLILSVVPKPGHTLKYSLIEAAGLVLIVGGTVVLARRKALVGSGRMPESGQKSHGSPILLGAGVAGLEMLTAFPYFAAIAIIIGSDTGTPGKVFLLILYCVVYTLPLIAIAVVCVVMGKRAEDVLRPVVDWLFARWPVILGTLAVAVGIALAVNGIVHLSSRL